MDDLLTMMIWWRLLRWAQLEHYRYGGYQWGPGVERASGGSPPGGSPGGVSPQDHNRGPEEPPSPYHYLSLLYEHMNFDGSWLTTEINKGWEGYDYGPQSYPNLEWVGRGILNWGDWDDVISSVNIYHGACVLYEHKHFGVWDGGSSLTLTSSEPYLEGLGWNDRVTSVEAF